MVVLSLTTSLLLQAATVVPPKALLLVTITLLVIMVTRTTTTVTVTATRTRALSLTTSLLPQVVMVVHPQALLPNTSIARLRRLHMAPLPPVEVTAPPWVR
jgi:hypothetical protein